MLLGSFSGSCLTSFIIKTRTTYLGNVAAHSGLVPPASVKTKDPAKTYPKANLLWVISQLRVPFQVTLHCLRLC